MREFKVGDVVEITGNCNGHGYADGDIVKLTERKFNSVVDAVYFKTDRVKTEASYQTASNCVRPQDMKLVVEESKTIHITTKGTSVHAILKENDKVVKRSVAMLHPDDTYDFNTGVRVAIDKLIGKMEEEKPTRYKEVKRNAKLGDLVKVITTVGHSAPIGHIGKIVVGRSGDRWVYVENKDSYNGMSCLNPNNYVVLEPTNAPLPISDYTNEELLAELKKRMVV